MDWRGALIARLLDAAAVTDLVGRCVNWIERPQGSGLPAITLQAITDGRDQHFGGFQTLQMVRVQADVWAATYVSARAVAEAVIATLTPAHDGNGIRFTRAMVEAGPDQTERVAELTVYRARIDFIIHHQTL